MKIKTKHPIAKELGSFGNSQRHANKINGTLNNNNNFNVMCYEKHDYNITINIEKKEKKSLIKKVGAIITILAGIAKIIGLFY